MAQVMRNVTPGSYVLLIDDREIALDELTVTAVSSTVEFDRMGLRELVLPPLPAQFDLEAKIVDPDIIGLPPDLLSPRYNRPVMLRIYARRPAEFLDRPVHIADAKLEMGPDRTTLALKMVVHDSPQPLWDAPPLLDRLDQDSIGPREVSEEDLEKYGFKSGEIGFLGPGGIVTKRFGQTPADQGWQALLDAIAKKDKK